jgi:hypothetical protein
VFLPQTPGSQPGPSSQPPSAGAAVRVVVGELNVREGPAASTQRLATVKRGTIFVLSAYEPILADGYTWWAASEVTNTTAGELPPLPTTPETWVGIQGFIAVGRGTTPYAEGLALRCPARIDLVHVVAMLRSERAACFGNRPVVLEGTLTCGECEGMGPPETFEPAWLADARVGPDLAVSGTGALNGLRVHFPPDLAEDDLDGFFLETGVRFGSILRIVGHFNDLRSATCEFMLYVNDETSHRVAPAYAEEACRQHFVVETYEVLGTDPAFVPPF